MCRGSLFQASVAHHRLPRLSVELEEDGSSAVGIGFADGQELDHQGLAGLDVHRDFVSRLHAVEELGSREDADVAEFPMHRHVVEKHIRIQQVAQHLVMADIPAELSLQELPGPAEVGGRKIGSGTRSARFSSPQDDGLQARRPSSRGCSQ